MVKYDMTCVNSPLDIQTDGAEKCTLKCLLHYKYGDSACSMKNQNTMLVIVYDGVSDVVFNNTKYTPVNIRIMKPSMHKYSGEPAAAEIIIQHTSNQGGLYICIPITVGGKLTQGSYLIKDLLSAAPLNGESATPSVPDFNANYLIPSSRYYTYAAPSPGETCNRMEYQYVVFHPKYGSLVIDNAAFEMLDSLVQPSYMETSKGVVAVNMKGTTTNGFAGDGQIYIDCQPTGESEEEVVFKEAGPVTSIPNDTLMTILMIVIGIAFIYGTFVLMKLVLGNVNKITSAPTVK